jgi:hypothetical protein
VDDQLGRVEERAGHGQDVPVLADDDPGAVVVEPLEPAGPKELDHLLVGLIDDLRERVHGPRPGGCGDQCDGGQQVGAHGMSFQWSVVSGQDEAARNQSTPPVGTTYSRGPDRRLITDY